MITQQSLLVARQYVTHIAVIFSISVAVFYVSIVFLLYIHAPKANALYTCNSYQSFHKVPTGYGAAYDVFQSNKETILNADCGLDDFRINIGHEGKTPQNFAVYKTGYRWTGSAWQAVPFSPNGGSIQGDYILGKAVSSGSALDYASGSNTFFVAFTCSLQSGAWKCGCRDNTCATHHWQLQGAAQGGALYGSGSTGTGTGNTTTPDADMTLDGMHLVAQHTINESEVGKVLTKEHLFGQYGLSARTVNPVIETYRTVGRAPDGRISVQENVPKGTVPETTSYSHHFGSGATKAAFQIDIWVPTGFTFPSNCGSYAVGQGRLPFGLWAGLPTKTSQPSGGGESIASQDSISFRINRGGLDLVPGPYVYNLNRYSGVCEAAGVCSIAGCTSPNQQCFGSGTKDAKVPIPFGRWVTVEGMMKMDSPGANDGCISLKVDGKSVANRCGYDFGRDKGWLIQGFYGYGLWHCNGSPKEQKFWYSNLRMYSN